MTVPRLAPGVRLTFDGRRDRWMVQAPERVVVLDAIGAAVLAMVDGVADVGSIVTSLAAEYDAPEAEIEADIIALLDDLTSRGIVINA
jgi:pyrroloquinoline quinone biosynthesis protein D